MAVDFLTVNLLAHFMLKFLRLVEQTEKTTGQIGEERVGGKPSFIGSSLYLYPSGSMQSRFNVNSDLLLIEESQSLDSMWILTYCWQKNHNLWIQGEFWPIVDRGMALFGFSVNYDLLLAEESHSLDSMWILTYWKKNVYLIIFKFTMNLEYLDMRIFVWSLVRIFCLRHH